MKKTNWVTVIIILGILLMLVGGLVSKLHPSLLTNGHTVPNDVRIYTDYMFSRSLALAVVMLAFLAIKARRALAVLLVVLTLIQCIDFINDATRGDFMLLPGIFVLIILFLIAARQLLGQPLWQQDAWCQ